MGFFDLFKDSEPDQQPQYDPTNIRLDQIERGFMLDYQLKSWIVEEVYEYDWGNNHFSWEYRLNDGSQTCFLTVDADDGLFLSVSQKVKIRNIDPGMPEYIEKNEQPPESLKYEGLTFWRDKTMPGYFQSLDDPNSDWEPFVSWDYYDADETHVLTIEQWDNNEFEASFGQIIRREDISNIIPGEPDN